MYIRGTDDCSCLQHKVFEVIDNSNGEALAGHCKNISIIINSNNTVPVQEDGRGIPVYIIKEETAS